jgi:hypothetical protein
MTYPLSYDTMTQAEVLHIVQTEAESMGLGILETLQFYKANPHEFGSVERCAFNTALRGFQRLLAPAESN